MKLGEESERGPPASAEHSPQANAPVGVEAGAPTCPRQRWFSWRNDLPQPEDQGRQQPPMRHWCPWHRNAPQGFGDGKEWEGNWPPRNWQEWRELRSFRNCPWRHHSPSTPSSRQPLDDSRWLEDFFSWY